MMETAALVAPVTALEFFQDAFLLTGEGPVLTAYSLQPKPKACTSMAVLQHYRIHGIRPKILSMSPSSDTETKGLMSTDLAVFGGKAIRLLRLHFDVSGAQHPRLEILGPLVELQDWALDVRWLCEDTQPILCVAVAHNAALLLDMNTGSALAQRSCLEGCLLYSALLVVHKCWDDTILVGGTVFNQLVLWKPGGKQSEHKGPVERRLLGHTGVIFSIFYLQEKGWLASASDDRSVRVWAVGALGGPGGSCGHLNPTCLQVLFGHQARVFSVRLSTRRVFSAGEDGACLVWDLAGGGTVVRTLKGHRAGGIRALAVTKKRVATGGADGGVRLWQVEENEDEETLEAEKITDLEFSGDGAPKVVCLLEDEDDDRTKWSKCKIAVCTDQGIVYQYDNGDWELLWRGTPEFQSYCVMETVAVRVKASRRRVNLCAVGSLGGALKVFSISQPQNGIFLQVGSGKIYSLIWQTGGKDLYLLASSAEGHVHRWCIDVTLNPNDDGCSLGIEVNRLPSFVLPPCAKRWLTAAVRLPSEAEGVLWVCGDRRGSLLLFQDRKTDEISEGLTPLSCLFGVHGKQGVTSVCEYDGLLYSTGRDGCVRVFRVHQAPQESLEGSRKDSLQLEVLRVQRACKGMEWLEKVLIMKPTNSEEDNDIINESESQDRTQGHGDDDKKFKMENKGREARFVIFGFHAFHFVVWDPVRQERLLVVPCGGGHRSWSVWPPHKQIWPGYGALVFIKQGTVLASEPPGELPRWSGSVTARNEGWSLREGIHGRGIGCVCRLGSVKEWEIIVTGGEDTSLTVLAVHPNSGSVKVLSIITDHISSVRTMAVLTRQESGTQSQSFSALLVSASGRAQMQCYRLYVVWDEQRLAPSCQVVQVAGHRLDEHWERRRNRHKMVKMDPETRYMSMAVLDQNQHSALVVLACSDGAVRLFSVSESKHQIDLLWETFHHQRCVLSVATCSLEDGKGNRYLLLFSAATDGQIAVWDLTQTTWLSSLGSPSASATPPTPCLIIAAHQSGVNSLAVWADTHQDGSCLVRVSSGGDDGQLTASIIRVQYPQEDGRTGDFTALCLHLLSQWNVPLAHAAPLTSLKRLKSDLIVTASCDQRVCLWKLCSTGISCRGVLCSHVADAAGLAAWEKQVMLEDDGKRNPTSEVNCGRMESQTCLEGAKLGKTGGWGGKDQEVTDEAIRKTENLKMEEENTEIASCEKKKARVEKTGWVLVCGQGFQLLQVTNKHGDEDETN
ncbi:WD repeat-containing protein 6 isoform X2 [Dunckerocampus dactyliophorus]|uniref:WD repeat-containing protein 6 isoform X2 n=1 Tax=Dunckerocampus dactyliophorus TaxID=161453 RepID=UPI0024055B59|nr:WD repeat-containing protein 6 isoform X2 [Dunckerocampus dactyliophorus]XP_054624346.1 WD repeat-containing protein 6 isoform X2 [Dunckerocampus dactyliophorus]XP_054624355.1 WD repeat-containing protein 6 isoform X2 [Dunckerocampus dactyliophorus]XP_054624363.1 WD repeat-containing protein 6 isoform X2 [Dunckerocampus dactyliophorus]XP_054624371.1 WD repeat-containing protein 6 isoform X2 [Dunckerocampus dactyliophorus]